MDRFPVLNALSARHTIPMLPSEVRAAAHEHFNLQKPYLDERKHALHKTYNELCHRSVHITSGPGTYLSCLR